MRRLLIALAALLISPGLLSAQRQRGTAPLSVTVTASDSSFTCLVRVLAQRGYTVETVSPEAGMIRAKRELPQTTVGMFNRVVTPLLTVTGLVYADTGRKALKIDAVSELRGADVSTGAVGGQVVSTTSGADVTWAVRPRPEIVADVEAIKGACSVP